MGDADADREIGRSPDEIDDREGNHDLQRARHGSPKRSGPTVQGSGRVISSQCRYCFFGGGAGAGFAGAAGFAGGAGGGAAFAGAGAAGAAGAAPFGGGVGGAGGAAGAAVPWSFLVSSACFFCADASCVAAFAACVAASSPIC